MFNEILTSSEAAELLRISVHTLRGMARSGDIPGFLIGDDWRFVKADLIRDLSNKSLHEQNVRRHAEINNKKNEIDANKSRPRGRPRKSRIEF